MLLIYTVCPKKSDTPIFYKHGFYDNKLILSTQLRCKFCRSKWRRIKGLHQIWRVCELCDMYVCPKCVPKDMQVDEDFVCRECSWHLE